MKGKKIKIEFLAPALIVLLAGGLGGMLVRPTGEPDTALKNRFGDVVWNHGLHTTFSKDIKCITCHHKETIEKDAKEGATVPKPCKECHKLPTSGEGLILAGLFGGSTAEPPKKPNEGPPAMQAYHGKCVGCHRDAMKKGPVGCRDCHGQKFSGDHGLVEWNHLRHARRMDDLECGDCHHDTDDYKPVLESEYKGCNECHARITEAPAPLEPLVAEHEEVRHGDCAYCHAINNPEEDVTSCAVCHPDLDKQEYKKQPISSEEAVHRKCLSCHNQNYEDLEEGMPAICEDCHQPTPSVLSGWTAGSLLWSHTRHLPEYNNNEWKCETCHHEDIPGYPHLACGSCHGQDDYSLPDKKMPSLADALFKARRKPEIEMKNCIECHTEKKDGPTRFDQFTVAKVPGAIVSQVGPYQVAWDHRLHADSLAFSCRECHHNTRTEGGALVICPSAAACPEEEGMGAMQRCQNCHGESGAVAGSLADSPELQAPKLADAFQRPCLECHQKLGAGPLTWEELTGK